MLLRLFLLFGWFLVTVNCFGKSLPISPTCQKWFNTSGVKKDKTCELKCAIISTDMGTFDCPNQCAQLCKEEVQESNDLISIKISDLYPGLTDAERKFVDKNPAVALKAYVLSWKAEQACHRIYSKSDTNDESDACRHYVWAGLLNFSIGQKQASEILDAHEANDLEPENERAMDLANNRRGVIVSNDLIAGKKADVDALLEHFKDDLKKGKLIVLKRKAK